MLARVDLDRNLSKASYRRTFPGLQLRLGECQRAALAAGIPVILVFEGWEAAGKGTLINQLVLALDPRGFKVHPISAPDANARLHPWMWRFWQLLPPRGRLAIFDRSWYGRVLVERMEKLTPSRDWRQAYADIREFEQKLIADGAVIVKFWLHIDQREQRRRFRHLVANRATAWKVSREEWRQNRRYEAWCEAVEDMLARTGSSAAPWTIVAATHGRRARVEVFRAVTRALSRALARRRAAKPPAPARPAARLRRPGVLDRIDLSQRLSRPDYDARIEELQTRLFALEHELYRARLPLVVVYEGCDAGGKGGNIRRLTQGLDPRGYEVVPIAAPAAEERAQHYLWRFWRHVPKAGHITIFDRSWYGRVLVERVEGFCAEAEWKCAFGEINAFERQLVNAGTVVVKFWLQIDLREQLRRFQARQETPWKQWKITDEDWRNRRKWRQYAVAIDDMLCRTSTPHAPWTILEANCKLHARVKALATVVRAVELAL